MKKAVQLITTLFCFALGVSSLHAANGVWTTAGSGNWSDSSKWTGGIIANGGGFSATFPSLGPTPTTITLDSSRTLGLVQFTPNGRVYDFSGGTTLTLEGLSPCFLRAVSGGTLNVNVVIAGGANGIRTPNQTGTVVFNMANTFTGDIQIHRGKVKYGIANAIPSGAGKGNVVMLVGTGFGGTGEAATLDLGDFNSTINGLSSLVSQGAAPVYNFPVVTSTGTTLGTSTLTVGGNDANGTFNGTFNGTIIDGPTRAVALTKIGNGTQILIGNNTYSGGTIVYAGTLVVNGSLGPGLVTVYPGANLLYDGVINDTCDNAITLTAGWTPSVYTVNATSTGDPTPSCGSSVGKGVWFTFTPSVSGMVTINTCGSDFDTAVQVYTGICGSLTPVSGACNDDNGPSCTGTRASVRFNGTAGTTYRIFAGGCNNASGNLRIYESSQDQNGVWTTAGSGNWSDSSKWTGGIIANGAGFSATFPSLGPTPTTITLDSDRIIATVAFTPNGRIYNFNGGTTMIFEGGLPNLLRAVSGGTLNVNVVIAGGASGIRTPNQTGTVVFNTNNTFTGDLQIHRGKVKYGIANAIPSGAGKGNVVMLVGTGFGGNGEGASLDLGDFDSTINGLSSLEGGVVVNYPVVTSTGTSAGTSTLTVGGNDANGTFNGRIIDGATRAVALTKIGNGTQILTNHSTYSGATTVNAGSLLVNGSIGGGATASAVTVNGGTFGGVGTCYGSVTVGAGGSIGAGASAGRLTIWGGLDLSSGGTNIWELATNSTSNPGTGYDVINCPARTLNVTNATLSIRLIGSVDVSAPFWASPHTWNIITAAGGSGTSNFKRIQVIGNLPMGTFTTMNGGTNVVLTFIPGGNDTCTTAMNLPAGATCWGNTLNATSTGDPTPSCGSGVGKGVWFTFIPSVNGQVNISTCGSDFDTVVQVYTGNCGSLTPVSGGCNDDNGPSCAGNRASVRFAGTTGTTYRILAGGFGGASGNLSINVTAWDDHGDSIATATSVGIPSTTSGRIESAGDNDYFRVQVASAGHLTVYTTGSTDPYGYLLDSNGNTITSNDDTIGRNFQIERDVTPGTYYVRVRHWSSSGNGDYVLEVRLNTTPAGGSVTVYATESYSPQTGTLTMTARAVDSLYGTVTSGSFGWTLERPGQGVIRSGVGSYNSGTGQWQASSVFGSGLTPGDYIVRYTMTTDRGRQGTTALPLTVSAPSVVVNGTVKDASSQALLSGAQVALFAAGGANGVWTLVNSQYDGVMPPLSTLLTQLSPIRPVITTVADGAFSWSDVPVANSYVLVAAKSGYQQQYSSSFNVTAAGTTITRNFQLSAVNLTLAALSGDVDAVRLQMTSLLDANARTMGDVAAQYYDDDIYSANVHWFNFVGSVAGRVAGGLESVASGITPLTVEAMERVQSAVFRELVKTVERGVVQEAEGWFLGNVLPPADYLGYVQSQAHTVYSQALTATNSQFQSVAAGTPLAAGFSQERFLAFGQGFVDSAVDVMARDSKYLFSPLSDGGTYGFTLDTLGDGYVSLSKTLAKLGTAKKVLSGVQIVGGAVVVGAAATGVGAPAAGVAATATKVAGFGKDAIYAVELGLKPQMGFVFASTVGAYARDNSQVASAYGDFVSFLKQEAISPFYLHASNRFKSTVEITLPKDTLWAVGGLPGLDVAQDMATVKVRDQSTVASGSLKVAARCVSYCVWKPVTIKSLLGAKEASIRTSSDVRGPATISAGGLAQFQVPYRGQSKNFLSQFKPHYLVVESSIGPWKAGSAYKPFYVLAPGEIFRPLTLSAPMALVSAEQVVAPASTKSGRVRLKDAKFGPENVTPLVVDTLSAASPALSATFTAGTNLWAIDVRLFAPVEVGVSLLVTDSQGRRLGYSSTNGMTYNELTGFVTDQQQHPISLRLLNPPAGETYTATVALLTPGPQPVAVSLFEETEEISDALMVANPSRVIVDLATTTEPTVNVQVFEGSQQKPLTNVTATLTNLVKWNGTTTLPLLSKQTQTVGDVGAGEGGSVSWPILVQTNAECGKYVSSVLLTSAQTADLNLPVVALVRRATNVVSLFEGTNSVSGILQTTVTNGGGGNGETWVHVPKGYYVVYALMGVAANSTNLVNPTINIGADGSTEWAFSGLFNLGVVVDNVETAFNNYLVAHPSSSNSVAVPIRLTGNAGESMQFGGLQLYLENVPNELRSVAILPDGKASFELVGQPGYSYAIQASVDLVNWSNLTTLQVTNSVTPFIDSESVSFDQRYYRAVLQ